MNENIDDCFLSGLKEFSRLNTWLRNKIKYILKGCYLGLDQMKEILTSIEFDIRKLDGENVVKYIVDSAHINPDEVIKTIDYFIKELKIQIDPKIFIKKIAKNSYLSSESSIILIDYLEQFIKIDEICKESVMYCSHELNENSLRFLDHVISKSKKFKPNDRHFIYAFSNNMNRIDEFLIYSEKLLNMLDSSKKTFQTEMIILAAAENSKISVDNFKKIFNLRLKYSEVTCTIAIVCKLERSATINASRSAELLGFIRDYDDEHKNSLKSQCC